MKQAFLSFSGPENRGATPFIKRLLRDNVALVLLLEDLESEPLEPDHQDVEKMMTQLAVISAGPPVSVSMATTAPGENGFEGS